MGDKSAIDENEYVLEPYYEQGIDGYLWAFVNVYKSFYEGVKFLTGGENVRIFNTDHSIAFEGIIEIDTKSGWQPFPDDPKNGLPVALDHWVCWTCKGFTPNDWAELFFHWPSLHGEFIT